MEIKKIKYKISFILFIKIYNKGILKLFCYSLPTLLFFFLFIIDCSLENNSFLVYIHTYLCMLLSLSTIYFLSAYECVCVHKCLCFFSQFFDCYHCRLLLLLLLLFSWLLLLFYNDDV